MKSHLLLVMKISRRVGEKVREKLNKLIRPMYGHVSCLSRLLVSFCYHVVGVGSVLSYLVFENNLVSKFPVSFV